MKKKFTPLLLEWYTLHKRDLPWRHTRDPYHIWICEIIMQQTRIAQGLAYYLRFIERFPSPLVLAEASEDEVLKYWQGLGYYSRARNLHVAARSMKRGIFPSTYEDVRALKGVGDYTAAAICSIAYNMPYAVLDGNVYRVLSRVFGIRTPIDSPRGKKEFSMMAQQLLDKRFPGDFNEALMDFGAICCTPQKPQCKVCPFESRCIAHQLGKETFFPVKSQKTKISTRYFHYIYVKQGPYTWLHKRENGDIWQNLYEPVLLETPFPPSLADLTGAELYKSLFGRRKLVPLVKPIKHVLSHQVIYADLWEVVIPVSLPVPNGYVKVLKEEVSKYAVSRLVQRLLESGG